MTDIYLYNTLSRNKQKFEPIDCCNVRMYVCGPTVYDRAHLGNARPPVTFDILNRLLRYVYGDEHVTYVSNITDVDDKILNKHKQTGRSIADITEETFTWYVNDMKSLNVIEPNHRPRATEYIQEMIEIVKRLIDNGHAYEVDGQVLFSVSSMKNYGALSGRSLDDMLAGARVEVADYKENPADFILWKPSDATQPGWESPWGYGRPGWHLECSAMSSKLLGNDFDIHGGGTDLVFPHHENECAQSCCAFKGSTFARYWVHNGMVNVDGVKMSKSLGNFHTLGEVLDKAPAEALRFIILSTHYHQPFNFTFEGLDNAKSTLDKFYNALLKNADVEADVQIDERLVNALKDDLNTPLAISYLHEHVNNLNKAESLEEKSKFKGLLIGSASMLGLLYNNAGEWFKGSSSDDNADIDAKIQARIDAKNNKDWALADKIRTELKDLGIVLEDSPSGTTWKKM